MSKYDVDVNWDMMDLSTYKDEVDEQLTDAGNPPSTESDESIIEHDHIMNVPPSECADNLND